jgi:hypothetical protein
VTKGNIVNGLKDRYTFPPRALDSGILGADVDTQKDILEKFYGLT